MRGIENILISRTDSIGDVVLTLPMAGVLKEIFPKSKIIFLGRKYTRDVIAMSKYVDEFVDWGDLSDKSSSEQIAFIAGKQIDCLIHVFPRKEIALLGKKAGIPLRIGTTNRLYHWFTCNKLIPLSRKKSDLHEAQLNLKLIELLGAKENYSLPEIETFYGFKNVSSAADVTHLLAEGKQNIILHPRSKGSAREWGLENFSELIRLLPESKCKIFVSGTKEEGAGLQEFFKMHPQVTDLTGKLALSQFIDFISKADALVAASTGPLHIAAALGKKAVGLFVPLRPIHPGRWAPVGKQASVLVADKECTSCQIAASCSCIKEIKPQQVAERLLK